MEKQELEEGGESKQVQQQGGGVLYDIGETIVEIGRTAKDFVAGRGQFEGSEQVEVEKRSQSQLYR